MKISKSYLKKLIKEELNNVLNLNEMNSYVYAWNNELAGSDARKTVDDSQIRDMIGKSGLKFEDYLSAVKKVMSEAGTSMQAIKEVEGRIRAAYDASLDTRDARIKKGEI